ncbi:MAG: hypothetical protein M5U34_45790 [Chloroflexi bacterium]|nr:hypothetical protein [Chloroflexota bacterium]
MVSTGAGLMPQHRFGEGALLGLGEKASEAGKLHQDGGRLGRQRGHGFLGENVVFTPLVEAAVADVGG